MKQFLRRLPELNSNLVIAVTALFIVVANNHSFWSAVFQVIDVSRSDHRLFVLAVSSLIFAILFVLLSLFNFRYLLKPALFVFLVTTASMGYFMDSFGTVIDMDMIQNVMETDTHEAGELFNMSLLGHILLYGIIPALVITAPGIRQYGWKKDLLARGMALLAVISITGVSVYYSYKDISFVFREHRNVTALINPVSPIRSLVRYYKYRHPAEKAPLQEVFSDATRQEGYTAKPRKSVFVIVLGETARASNFHTNGYQRNTTPRVEQENIFNFSNTSSCGTATAISVPCIFSELGHDNYDDSIAKNSENLLDALHRAGINVLWRDNNSGCKGVCERVATENMHHLNVSDYCTADGCFDEVLLYKLQEYIDQQQNDTVIVLHQQGSHGPTYYKRYPEKFAAFQPECNKADVQNCSYDEIVNAYDNTILYTDYFLSRVIELLKHNEQNHDVAMMYVSDHGESLGENGIFLHGLPYMIAPEEQTRVPFMVWMSDNFIHSANIDTGCFQQQERQPHSHDDILHSVLGVMGVKTQRYNREHDIFSSCSNSIGLKNIAGSEHPGTDLHKSTL